MRREEDTQTGGREADQALGHWGRGVRGVRWGVLRPYEDWVREPEDVGR